MESEEEGRIRAVTNAEKVSYVDGNIEIETESGDKTNIANVDSETVPETSEEESVASAIEGDPDQDDITFAIDDKEAANRGQQLSLALSDMLKSKEPTYPVINDFWNSLQSGDRAKLRKALGIETVEGLISEFTVEDNIFTEEEFIEDINSCHL